MRKLIVTPSGKCPPISAPRSNPFLSAAERRTPVVSVTPARPDPRVSMISSISAVSSSSKYIVLDDEVDTAYIVGDNGHEWDDVTHVANTTLSKIADEQEDSSTTYHSLQSSSSIATMARFRSSSSTLNDALASCQLPDPEERLVSSPYHAMFAEKYLSCSTCSKIQNGVRCTCAPHRSPYKSAFEMMAAERQSYQSSVYSVQSDAVIDDCASL